MPVRRPDPLLILLDRECAHKCAFCEWEYMGKATDGIRLAREHRETVHGVIVKEKKRVLGRCGLHTCNKTAVKRIQGRGLCPEHLEVVQQNAERRGWTTSGMPTRPTA
jgi:wyosine [tRNA(Phe)-imidazoG37] synthetase (radical SAM superfamily)